MNLLERIDRRLSDGRARINTLDFEDCATSLLSTEYPGLVPIIGGTDFGLDAEITGSDGVVGLMVTSSRTWDGACRSLRDSLRSMTQRQLPVRHVMAANLAEVNRRRREKLKLIAEEFGCELIQVFDRAWFANVFRVNPDWRKKILGIAGGPFSLSREPRGARPDERQLPTVGRDQVLALATAVSADLVLWGVPGVGKSHVAARLPGALFLEGQPSPEQLLDDLLAAQPAFVVVDDAGGRIKDLDLLVRTRAAEQLGFRVATTCWPHEVDEVADHLPGADRLEVDLLTREELGGLLRERGITRPSVLAQLLEQAQGRPGWALNLADLLVGQGDWRSVWTGRALRDQIFAFLRRSKSPREAIELMGAIALLGEVNEDQARRLAELFGLRPVEFQELIRSVAIAGLVDVRRFSAPAPDRDQPQPRWLDYYRVVPRVIAASIVSDVFFAGRATPVSLSDIHERFPELAAQIIQTQIHTTLVGATDPEVPTTRQVLDILATSSFDEEAELLRSFALLGPGQTQSVIGLLVERVQTACTNGDGAAAMRDAKMLADRVADAVRKGNSAPVEALLDVSAELAVRGLAFRDVLHKLVEGVRDARNGDIPTADDMLTLSRALANCMPTEASSSTWVALAAEVLAPTFDGNYMSPEVMRQMVLQSFTWPADEMAALYDVLRPGLRQRLSSCATAELNALVELLEKWVRIAHGTNLPFGGHTTAEQEAAGKRIAADMVADLATVIANPGLRAKFNRLTANMGVRLEEPDRLFAHLAAERDLLQDWENAGRLAYAELDQALVDFMRKPPEVLMSWITKHKAELAMVPNTTTAGWRVLDHLGQQPDAEVWLESALDHNLGGLASGLIDKCVAERRMAIPLAQNLMRDSGARPSLISAILRYEPSADLVTEVVEQLTGDDIKALDSAFAIHQVTATVRHALFTHPVPDVRANAAALWAAERSLNSEDVTVDPEWVQAMGDLTIPSVALGDHMQSEALKVFARSAAARYIALMAQHARDVDKHDDFDEWQESVRELATEDRQRLWEQVCMTPMAHELFWIIAGGDTEWIERTLRDESTVMSASRLLHAWRFQFGARPPVETLAKLFMPLGVEPDDILWTLEVGTHVGEDHDRYARHLEKCRELADADDPDLVRLGTRGVEIYEPRLAAATKRARIAAVRGVHGI